MTALKQAEQSGSVAEKVNLQYSKDVEENRKYLYAICESLIFCGRQSTALRGHDESDYSKNKGNFLELMELRCKDNESVSYTHLDVYKRQFLDSL